MLHQSVGRSQREKALTIKRAVQITLLLLVAVWLLYQIQNSHFKSKKYSINSANKIREKGWTVALGRKGNAGSNDEEAENDTGGGSKEDGGDGNDELDRNSKENISQEFLLLKGHEDSDENAANKVMKGEETKDQQDELKSNEEESSDAHVKDGDEGVGEKESNVEENVKHNEEKHSENDPVKQKDSDRNADENSANEEEKGDQKDTEKQADEVEDNERNSADKQKSDGNEAANLDRDEDYKLETNPHTDKESTSVNPSTGTEADNFHDENGIPSDGFESVNENAVTNIDEEPILGLDNKILLKEATPTRCPLENWRRRRSSRRFEEG